MFYPKEIADSHIHIYEEKNTVNVLDKLYKLGIRDTNACALTLIDGDICNNLTVLYFKQKYSKIRIRAMGCLYYNDCQMDFLSQANRLLDMGCDGIKFIDMKPNYRKQIGRGMNSPLYDDMFDMLEEKQIPLVCHISDPDFDWEETRTGKWAYSGPGFLKSEEIYAETFERLEKNPNLNVTLAHFFFLSEKIELAEYVMERYPNVTFDLTPGWEMFVGFTKNPDEWKTFFNKYSKRILYGSDTESKTVAMDYIESIHKTVQKGISEGKSRFVMPMKTDEMMCGLNLDKDVQYDICVNNYKRMFGNVKPINIELFKDECDRIIKSEGCNVEWVAKMKREIG